MRGAWLTRGAAGLVLLFGSSSVCLAEPIYDRQLESAVMKIVASKMGDIRGPLDREWTPPATPQDSAAEPAQQPEKPISSPSFVSIDPPAIALYATTLAASLVTSAQTALEPIFGPRPERKVRVIPLYH